VSPVADAQDGSPAQGDPGDVVGILAAMPLFQDLSRDDLERLAGVATVIDVPAGATLMEEGDEAAALHVLLTGELEVTRREGGGDILLAVLSPGAFLGEMALVAGARRNATVRALRPARLLVIGPAEFHAVLAASPGAALTLLRTVAGRILSTEAAVRQNAKLASLGTLAAGLAHELNNPASALRRGSAELPAAVAALDRAARRVGRLDLSPMALEAVERIADTEAAGRAPRLDTLALAAAETALAEWLERHGVERPVDRSAPLALRGWSPDHLATAVDPLPAGHRAPVLEWLAARSALAALVDEARAASAAVSDIVTAVRAHTYLGQAPVQMVDVVTGLESTLVILRSRLAAGVELARDYEPDLPAIEAYGSELNQVWANLLDNAIHAVSGRGRIEVRARRGRDGVAVEVEDSGIGIPPEVLTRIFDPFFTTRDQGAGTGLGLHVAYTVVRKHRGRISVASRPGRTVFTVELPLRLSATGR
jgi:signal transduction histidine kinase